jgi:hypothetical protein
MVDRKITLHGVHPVHPGRSEPSRIELLLILDYIKGAPIVAIEISHEKALSLIEQLAFSARVVKS